MFNDHNKNNKQKKLLRTKSGLILVVFVFFVIFFSRLSTVVAQEEPPQEESPIVALLFNTVVDPMGKLKGDNANILEYETNSFDNNLQPVENSIGIVVKFLLGFSATIFFILVIYAGLIWMTSQGNEEKVTKAQKLLIQSTMGLMVTFFAYLISFAIAALLSRGTGFLLQS